MSRRMERSEWRAFLAEGMRTGELGTVRRDGAHVLHVWFVLAEFARRNAVAGQLLVRLRATNVFALDGISD